MTIRKEKIDINVKSCQIQKVAFTQILLVSAIYQIFYKMSGRFNDLSIIISIDRLEFSSRVVSVKALFFLLMVLLSMSLFYYHLCATRVNGI